MRISKSTVYITGAMLCLVMIIGWFVVLPYLAIYLLGKPSEPDNLVEISSPNKTLIVDVFNSGGGATDGNYTQAVIRRRGDAFDTRKNFCLITLNGIKKLKVFWANDTKLEVQYESDPVYRAPKEWNGISISYSEIK
jgi:hypothetical protein